MERLTQGFIDIAGWLFYLSLLMVFALAVPQTLLDPTSRDFLLLLGAVGIWRYSMGLTHFLRGLLFLYIVFPHYRRKARQLAEVAGNILAVWPAERTHARKDSKEESKSYHLEGRSGDNSAPSGRSRRGSGR